MSAAYCCTSSVLRSLVIANFDSPPFKSELGVEFEPQKSLCLGGEAKTFQTAPDSAGASLRAVALLSVFTSAGLTEAGGFRPAVYGEAGVSNRSPYRLRHS